MKGLYRILLPLVLLTVCLFAFPTQSIAEEYVFAGKWGVPGSGEGQLFHPEVVNTSNSKVYVTEYFNHRVQIFSTVGTYLGKLGLVGAISEDYLWPRSIAVGPSGDIYIAELNSKSIQKFDGNGNFILKWGSYGTGDMQFTSINGLAADSLGNIYVLDAYDYCIKKYSSGAVGMVGVTFIKKWGTNIPGEEQSYIQPEQIKGIAADSAGNVYVAEADPNRIHVCIKKFDTNGNFIRKWGSWGTSNEQFSTPWGLAVDSEGKVYVIDMIGCSFKKFDANGNFITKFGSYGSGDGQFYSPTGIAVDSFGTVYVADMNNNRIQKFVLAATSTTIIASTTITPSTTSTTRLMKSTTTTTRRPIGITTTTRRVPITIKIPIPGPGPTLPKY